MVVASPARIAKYLATSIHWRPGTKMKHELVVWYPIQYWRHHRWAHFSTVDKVQQALRTIHYLSAWHTAADFVPGETGQWSPGSGPRQGRCSQGPWREGGIAVIRKKGNHEKAWDAGDFELCRITWHVSTPCSASISAEFWRAKIGPWWARCNWGCPVISQVYTHHQLHRLHLARLIHVHSQRAADCTPNVSFMNVFRGEPPLENVNVHIVSYANESEGW